jgi:hypothetical protein
MLQGYGKIVQLCNTNSGTEDFSGIEVFAEFVISTTVTCVPVAGSHITTFFLHVTVSENDACRDSLLF